MVEYYIQPTVFNTLFYESGDNAMTIRDRFSCWPCSSYVVDLKQCEIQIYDICKHWRYNDTTILEYFFIAYDWTSTMLIFDIIRYQWSYGCLDMTCVETGWSFWGESPVPTAIAGSCLAVTSLFFGAIALLHLGAVIDAGVMSDSAESWDRYVFLGFTNVFSGRKMPFMWCMYIYIYICLYSYLFVYIYYVCVNLHIYVYVYNFLPIKFVYVCKEILVCIFKISKQMGFMWLFLIFRCIHPSIRTYMRRWQSLGRSWFNRLWWWFHHDFW